jgi:hypothetical protein
VIEVLDGIVEMLEPRAERNSSINVDDAYAEPLEYKAETLYVFERSDDRRLAGTSPADINDFALTAVYVADDSGERAQGQRLREVTLKLDAKRERYLRKIRNNRTGPLVEGSDSAPLWANLTGGADPDFIRGLEIRGIAITLRGWRFVEANENG